MRPTKEVFLSIFFACIAMVFVSLMIQFAPSPTMTLSLKDKLVVSALFIASCCVGISLALSPGWIRRIGSKETTETMNMGSYQTRPFLGHHPDCERFQTHRIPIGNKTWCSGCFGLLLGALVSILFMAIYVIFSIGFSRFFFSPLLLLGLVFVVVIFFETISKNRYPATHVFFNAMLIPSFFFITMSVTELTGKALFGVFTVLLCVLWLDTRVTLSAWRHRSTCSLCKESCKMYALKPSSVSKSLEAQR